MLTQEYILYLMDARTMYHILLAPRALYQDTNDVDQPGAICVTALDDDAGQAGHYSVVVHHRVRRPW